MNILATTTVKNGDLAAVMSKQGELHALLNLICEDDFNSFRRLSGKRQFDLLNLARAVSEDLSEISASALSVRALRLAKEVAA